MSPARPASDMTTDEIVAEIRARMAAAPGNAAALADVANRLTIQLRDRLPYLEPTDIGAVLVNLGAYTLHAQQLFTEYGLDPATAALNVANVVAIAGQQLYVAPPAETRPPHLPAQDAETDRTGDGT